ncbi:MAG: hypothetical protein FJ211_10125 [Ignavibacteria bacterium]|nr:hypothetical protein [Ignavibacteria bacterium]
MPYILGGNGFIKFKRGSSVNPLPATVDKADVNTILNRVGVNIETDDLITGDRINFETKDPEGLLFLPDDPNSTPPAPPKQATYFIQRNNIDGKSAGGLRLFETFKDAVNNDRSKEVTIVDSWPAGVTSINITYAIEDLDYQTLGAVRSYTFSTERAAIDVTSLGDSFRRQYEAGLLSGTGSISCIFDYESNKSTEASAVMLQILNRATVGSGFDAHLVLGEGLGDKGDLSIFYEVTGVITKAGIEVSADSTINCEIDFVTTGDIHFRLGRVGATLTINSNLPVQRSTVDLTYLTLQATD